MMFGGQPLSAAAEFDKPGALPDAEGCPDRQRDNMMAVVSNGGCRERGEVQ
jgi:hypothetical protein